MELLPDHHADPAGDGLVEIADIQAGGLLKLVQTVGQSVAVDEKLPCRLREAQVIVKEGVDGPKGVRIHPAEIIVQKMLLQVALADVLRKAEDETGQAQRSGFIDLFGRVEGLADGKTGHKILVGGGQIRQGHCLVVIDHLDRDHGLGSHGVKQGGDHGRKGGRLVFDDQEHPISSHGKGGDLAAREDRGENTPRLLVEIFGEGHKKKGPPGGGLHVVAGKAGANLVFVQLAGQIAAEEVVLVPAGFGQAQEIPQLTGCDLGISGGLGIQTEGETCALLQLVQKI